MKLPHPSRLACVLASLALGLAPAALPVTAAEKIVITESDQLPRVAFPFEGDAIELLEDPSALEVYLGQLRTEIEDQLEKYDIRDTATVRRYLGHLRTLDFLAGDYDSALEKITRIRGMFDKPSDRLTSGLLAESLIEAYRGGTDRSAAEIDQAFTEAYAAKVEALPWDIVQDDIEGTNGSFQYLSENLYLGQLESAMQVTIDQNKELTLGDVASLASIRLMFDHILPRKAAIVEVTGAYIAANRVEKENIWPAREVTLTAEDALTPVVIAIWDSGVDAPIFEATGQMWLNEDEAPDGLDTDGNGFVDDLYGPSWDLESRRTAGSLYPLSEEELAAYPTELDFTKGLLDLQAAVDSEEAKATRERLSNIQRDEYTPFIENLGLYGNYTHGTHVAGIAAAGNPAARIMSSRITFGHQLIPDEPTLKETIRGVEETFAAIEYFRAAGVRVVNMSWGGSQAGLEGALEANGVGDTPEQRAEIARVLFELGYDALFEAMESAPEILFIPAAGNSDEDVDFNKIIPSSIDLPNVLVVGAVDQAGDETGFTSYGRNITVHANGFEVESYVPGGRRLAFSGTSMAAPNVANLAGKLFALDPSLTPAEVINLIEMGVDKTADGRRFLLNPKKSIALLRLRNTSL